MPWYDHYWYQYVFQNMLPFSVWTILAVVVAHWRTRKHFNKKMDEHHSSIKHHLQLTMDRFNGEPEVTIDEDVNGS